MTGSKVRQKYLQFFSSHGHKIIPSSPLVPENDPTTLFTSSGMQPLVPYLLGQSHPDGTRLVDSQKCFRSQDIEEVGNSRHTTFFEMLGNWSLGDYFKKDQLTWFWTFLTQELNLDPNRLYVTVFSGDKDSQLQRDDESIQIWKEIFASVGIEAKYVELETVENGDKQGMQGGRIFGYGAKKNWWSRSGIPSKMPAGEPGGPDSEVFFDFQTPHDTSVWGELHPNSESGRMVEVGNSVFMQYLKQADGSLKELDQKNVDFGGGFERLVAATRDNPDIFTSDLFTPIISQIEKLSNISYSQNPKPMRIIADHVRGSVMLSADGVVPSNKAQGYFLRRLIRRSITAGRRLNIQSPFMHVLVNAVQQTLQDSYPNITSPQVEKVISEEEVKFNAVMKKGLQVAAKSLSNIDIKNHNELANLAFDLFQSHGLPIDILFDELESQNQGLSVTEKESVLDIFDQIKQSHQDSSRSASAGMFKGGLQNQSEVTTKYHTATHLLHQALRNSLGNHVSQKGSNITSERLRFDFSHSSKLTPEQIHQIETEVNSQIRSSLPVVQIMMDKNQALAQGALAFFPEKYPDTASVFKIGEYSMELCGGPHVTNTSEIGKIKIVKEEGVSAGVRRIYAQLDS